MTDESIFAAALDRPTSEERASYLNAACDTPAQRARLDTLLAAHDRAGSFLGRPAVAVDSNSDVTHTTVPEEAVTRTVEPLSGDPADDADATSFLAPSDRPDSLGRIGQYEVLEVLGRGGFGIVYRAFDDKLQRVVAVKVLAPHMAVTSPARKRFLREARSAAAVRHQNVVLIHAVEEQPLPHLVMEYIPGETLQQRLDRTGPLEVSDALRLGRQIADGMAAAHAQGLIHRDIKPSNILLDTGPHPAAKITDFGLARAADDASLTRSGAVAGTPMYMAPEQARGETLDHRADLFSLGSVLYVMLSGRPPFRANSTPAVLKRVADDTPRPIREIIPEVPEWLCRIVGKLHAKNAVERFQTAREVADLLADCEKQLTERKELTDFSRIPGGKPVARKPWRWKWAGAGVTAALVVLLVAVWGNLFSRVKQSLYHELTVQLPDTATVVQFWETTDTVESENRKTFTGQWPLEPRATVANTLEKKLRLPPGHYYMMVSKGGKRVEQRLLTIGWGGSQTVVVALPPAPPRPVEDGFTPLFNGQDLSGWKTRWPPNKTWAVENGVLVGRAALNLLRTEREDFENFHLRAEVRLNAVGNSGILFRSQPGEDRPRPCYECEIGGAADATTGSLSVNAGQTWLASAKHNHAPPDTWFTLEVIAAGDRLTTLVNGWPVGKATDTRYRKGCIELQVMNPTTVVEFRKIEIRESPPPAGFTPLFNGKDLSGWKELPAERGSWTVENGVLVGKGKPSHLFTERGDFANYHLRVELRVRGGTKAGAIGVFGRVPEEDPGMVISPYGSGELYRGPVAKLYGPTPPPEKPPGHRVNPLLVWGGDLKGAVTRVSRLTPDEWITFEVIQDGDRVSTRGDNPKMNTFSVMHAGPTRPRGHLALQLFDDWSAVDIRQIEIKELPRSDPPADAERLKGEWAVVSATHDGKAVPDAVKEGISLRLGDGTFEMTTGRQKEAGTYQIDPVRLEVLLKPAGQLVPVRTPYRLEGDRLRLTLPGPPGDAAVLRDRSVSTNNLKQLGLAAVNYADRNGTLPPPALIAPKGNDRTPLLSWRVALLPHLEADDLYKQFKLDEPWDSEHNKALIPKMPKVFATPGAKATAGQTHCRAFTGPGTAFEASQDGRTGVTFADIRDGTASTLLIVEAAEPVVWTKPDDLPFDPNGPLPKLGVSADGANVVFCDAHTATLSVPVADDTLRGLVTRGGGEKVAVPVLIPAKSDESRLVLEFRRPTAAADLKLLREKVTAAQGTRDLTKTRLDVGTVSGIEMARADGDLADARAELALAEGNQAAAVTRLEELVKQRQLERDLIAVRVAEEVERADVLNAADARLATAKGKLANLRPDPKPAAGPGKPGAEAGDEFTPLFNGKDLAGWKTHPDQPGEWKVEDGVLVGRSGPSHLFTARGDYGDFHLRARARINAAGNSGIWFRSSFDLPRVGKATGHRYPNGHEAKISSRQKGDEDNKLTGGLGPDAQVLKPLHAVGEWFDLEVVAQGDRVRTLVNGQPAAEVRFGKDVPRTGHLVLQCGGSGRTTVIEFRTIEIRELPASSPPPKPAVAPFDAKEAKGHQERWAKHLGVPVEFENSVGMKLRVIPPGTFTMGAPPEEVDPLIAKADNYFKPLFQSEAPPHQVAVTRPFALGATPVTVGQWKAFLADDKYPMGGEGGGVDHPSPKGWVKDPKLNWKAPGFDQTDDHPVVGISWKDATAFCDWLTKREGRRYALPTEAQWEYACRAGTATAFHFGNDPSLHGDYDWHNDNSNWSTHPVGTKKGNPWGLFDLHGNVRNWTADWYAKDYYASSPTDDPTGPAAGTARVLRGGEWNRGKDTGRAAARLSHEPTRRATTIGFRVVVVGDLKGTPPVGDKPVK